MTPLERAEKIVGPVHVDRAAHDRLVEDIRVAIVEATDVEAERRREVEDQLRQRGYIVAGLLALIDGDREAKAGG